MTPESVDFLIRKARKADIPWITRLNAQLGYPESSVAIARRLRRIQRDRRDHRVFVAVAESKLQRNGPSGVAPVGWVHVFADKLLTVDRRAEIGGLVVDENWRSRGVGAALLKTAETWARKKGLFRVAVRTNVVRGRAHHFYEKCGYDLLKQSRVYIREIG
jgi:GNAT superfamily N-acetyltransferase